MAVLTSDSGLVRTETAVRLVGGVAVQVGSAGGRLAELLSPLESPAMRVLRPCWRLLQSFRSLRVRRIGAGFGCRRHRTDFAGW